LRPSRDIPQPQLPATAPMLPTLLWTMLLNFLNWRNVLYLNGEDTLCLFWNFVRF